MFSIDVSNLHWLGGENDTADLCAHGDMVATIGDEKLAFSGTASSTAIYLLKTLTEDHLIGEENQMMPCCGNFLMANEKMDTVQIMGCPNGVDWEVTHIGDKINIRTEAGNEVQVGFGDYKRAVFYFADKVEEFYKSAPAKKLPIDEHDKNGYIAFWNEWNRRRYEK